MAERFYGYDLIDLSVQEALRAIFAGGCAEPCTGPRCNCREELVDLVQQAFQAGRLSALPRPPNAATEQAERLPDA